MLADWRHQEPQHIPVSLSDLHGARIELAVQFLAPLLEAGSAVPRPVRMRLAPLVAKLRELAPLVRAR